MGFDRKAYLAAYYQQHKAEIKERSRVWAEAHPEERKKIALDYAHRWAGDPEKRKKLRLAEKKWRDANGKAYYAANRDTALRAKKASREKDPEKTRQQYRGYHQQPKYKAILRAAGGRRRARMRNSEIGDNTAVRKFYLHARTADTLQCVYCQKPLARDQRHVDHDVPIARGGAHSVENLVVSCARCNQTKFTKTGAEFRGGN